MTFLRSCIIGLCIWVAVFGLHSSGLNFHRPINVRLRAVTSTNEPTPADGTDDIKVDVGSSEYYKGFVSSPIQDESLIDRDPLGGLNQAIKLGAGASVVLGALTLGFMASNNLL